MGAMVKLLERQLGLWELKRRVEDLGQRSGRHLENNIAYGPCLLISRERGSGGGVLARMVGQRLGWCVFDREIVDEIAERAHVRLQLMETVDRGTRSKWEEDWQPELAPEDIGYEHYLRCLRQVVLTLGHHGDVIILGRGAQYLLPPECALRVRVMASLEARVQRMAESEGEPAPDLQARIQKFDVDKAEFTRRCFQNDVNCPLNYDLIINTGTISLERAAELVLLALGDKLGVRLQKS